MKPILMVCANAPDIERASSAPSSNLTDFIDPPRLRGILAAKFRRARPAGAPLFLVRAVPPCCTAVRTLRDWRSRARNPRAPVPAVLRPAAEQGAFACRSPRARASYRGGRARPPAAAEGRQSAPNVPPPPPV